MSKPKVVFINDVEFFQSGRDEVASVYALDHPHCGAGRVRTSKVIKHNEDGSFETLNTIYAPYCADDNKEHFGVK